MDSLCLATRRLRLTPFTLELLEAVESADAALYARLGVEPSPEWPEPDLVEALPVFRQELEAHGVTGLGPWLVLDQAGRILGSAGFLGQGEGGRVELGFGIVPGQRGRGYCSEAVRAMLGWAASRGVGTVVARCDADNRASRQVLESCGFRLLGVEQGLLSWEWGPQR